MSKKKSKYKKNKKYNSNNKNTIEKNVVITEKKNNEVEEKAIIEEVLETDANKKVEENIIVDEKNKNNKETVENVEIEKSIECNSLKSTEKKHFFLLVLKLIGVHIKNFFVAIGCFFKSVFVHINDFFEDRAEELDRKIREIKDEEVIKNKRRKLDYEKYNTKRIYKDLQRAERYKNRASSRVNTEKYFEDKIEKEKINNKILVNAAVEADEEEKEAYTYANNMRKRDRIEKKKNEILELRRKKKEEHQKAKEEREKELELLNEERRKIEEKEAKIKAEEERLISETEEVVKSLEQQLSFNSQSKEEDPYNGLFEEFGSEENLDEEEYDDDLPNLDDIIKMADEEDKIKNINYKQKHEDRIDEPYEKFENDVREIDEKLKSEILKLIDVPESETKDDFISEVELSVGDKEENIEPEEEIIEPLPETKSYIDTLMEEHKTIGDLLGEEEEETPKVEQTKSKENDPTVNIFAALRNANANVKNKAPEEKKEKAEFVPSNSKVRISDNQDGFDNIKLRAEKNNGNFYDAEKLNVGSWTKDAEEKIEPVIEKEEKVAVTEEEPYLKYKNPYEAYGKYIKSSVTNTVKEEPVEEKPEYTIESVFKDTERTRRVESNKEKREEKKEKKLHIDKRPKHAENKGITKAKLSEIFKTAQPQKRKASNDFDEDMYTNKFIKNIIDIDDNDSRAEKKNIENDMFKIEEDIFSEAYTKKIEEMNARERAQEKNEYQENNDDAVKILNVEHVTNDEIVMNAYVKAEPEYIHEPNEYYDNMLNRDDEDIKINYNNYLAQDSYYPREEREIKTVRNENRNRTYEYDDGDDEEKVSFGGFLKEMASNINSSISGIPESMRKRRESKNRIKRNQIYSTSYNRKGRRR